jgi:archaellum component FlaC
MTGAELLDFVQGRLFPELRALTVGGRNKELAGVIREALADADNYMKSGTLMRQVINKLNEIDFTARHQFGEIYEKLLADLQNAGNAGEFYTPRAVTQFAVDMVNPQLGESILDPACGTGGFLTGAIEHLRKHHAKDGAAWATVQESVRGIEKKQLPHLLCVTNMILHGIDVPACPVASAWARGPCERFLRACERFLRACERPRASDESLGTIDESLGTIDESLGTIDESLGAIDESLGAIDESLGAIDESLGAIDESLRAIDEGLGTIDESLRAIDESLRAIDEGLGTIDESLRAIDEGLGTIDERRGTIDESLRAVDGSLGRCDERLGAIDESLRALDESLGTIDESLGAIDESLGTIGRGYRLSSEDPAR